MPDAPDVPGLRDLPQLLSIPALPDSFTLADSDLEGPLTFYETSALWKHICRWLPCIIWLDWPGYTSATYDVYEGEKHYIIQCWKGWCGDLFQHFPMPEIAENFKFRAV